MAVLSERELEALRHVAAGHTDVEIGDLMGIQPASARFHVANAKKKLGARSRAHAVACGFLVGELQVEARP